VALLRQPSVRPRTGAPQVTGAWKKDQRRTKADRVTITTGPAASLIHAAMRSAPARTPHHCPKPPNRLLVPPEVAMPVIVATGLDNHAARKRYGRKVMTLFEFPHPVLRDGTDLLTEIPHPRRADLRSDATREGPADSQPGPGAGRTVQGGRSPARSAAAGALDRPARPAHSTSGRPRPPSPTATEWGTKSSPGEFHEASSKETQAARIPRHPTWVRPEASSHGQPAIRFTFVTLHVTFCLTWSEPPAVVFTVWPDATVNDKAAPSDTRVPFGASNSTVTPYVEAFDVWLWISSPAVGSRVVESTAHDVIFTSADGEWLGLLLVPTAIHHHNHDDDDHCRQGAKAPPQTRTPPALLRRCGRRPQPPGGTWPSLGRPHCGPLPCGSRVGG
jgi:hypothetical protein